MDNNKPITIEDEILAALRKTMYIEPYSPVAGFTNWGSASM